MKVNKRNTIEFVLQLLLLVLVFVDGFYSAETVVYKELSNGIFKYENTYFSYRSLLSFLLQGGVTPYLSTAFALLLLCTFFVVLFQLLARGKCRNMFIVPMLTIIETACFAGICYDVMQYHEKSVGFREIREIQYCLNESPVFYIFLSLLVVLCLITIVGYIMAKRKGVLDETFSESSYDDNSSEYDVIEYGEAYCGIGKYIFLYLFTFGIWNLVWIYRTTRFLNKTPGTEHYNPTSKLLLCMFVPFYQIYWVYKHGQRIDTFSKYKKLNNSDMATIYLILYIFVPIVACILMQDRINALCTAKTPVEKVSEETTSQNSPAQVVATTSAADELKKFKELLDIGAITQEEFDAKKKQLLGL